MKPNKMICIFSSGRSGSTWLAKLFDCHPDVFYLHEPSISDRGLDLLPFWFDDEPTPAQIEAARVYLERLESTRTPRSAGSRPFFRKHYRSGVAEAARRSIICAAKVAENAALRDFANAFYIPDLIDRGAPRQVVMKLVSGLGRAEALIKGSSGRMRPVLLMRHPCGQIASTLRGFRIGTLENSPSLGRLLDTRSAKRLAADPSKIEGLDAIEKLAWNWLLSNAEAEAAIRAAGGETVIYDELAADPKRILPGLLERIELDWVPEIEKFLQRTTSYDGGYFSVYRQPAGAANRWRSELRDEDVAKVRAIVTRDPIGHLFFNA